ncbi:GGDEF domain-containing protein [Amphritea japonica]|uniref:diguanylate cyclase n=1 Tax=Amphritea japonica ATCC BAA-1530 TaxID=1278309 RepID=A0A7R6P4G4_9GAMM|nr:GGDEF domain-containing protein [Amphritea japonica]BBB25809.1 diguanylate cyclase [Amphritea japonica ATCC BAA-1530]
MVKNKPNPYFDDSYDKAAANLRLALSVLAEHRLPSSPVNFRLAYDLIDGRSRSLNDEFKEVVSAPNTDLNDGLWALYRKFYIQDEEALELIRSELEGIVSGVVNECGTANGDLQGYSERLSSLADLMSSDAKSELTLATVRKTIEDTREVAESQQQLGTQLTDVLKEVREIRKVINQVRDESHIDSLTGVSNRRAFDLALDSSIDKSLERKEPLCLLLCDIDSFKQFNDTYGHLIGDKVLQYVAKQLKKSIKGRDFVSRFGGEEFAIILPQTPLQNAEIVAEQLRVIVSKSKLRKAKSGDVYGHVTLSFGVAELDPDETRNDLIERADRALYRAKKNGRNRVEVSSIGDNDQRE